MLKLHINLSERSYPIHIATGFSDLARAFASARISGKVVIITDSNVDGYYSAECAGVLRQAGFDVYKFVIPAGEQNKNLDTVRSIYKYLLELKLDRQAALVAFGGGVTGDITGFVAATFLRGINFIQVPTSLLAQADSSVGGKVGVDFEGSKNIIGAFYQPKFVYINVNTLRTLPEREIRSGLAEVIKHGLIMDADFFEYISWNMAKIFSFDENVLQYMTKMNCSIKGKVVEQDEKESDLRAILNFGHTIGHAVESASGFSLLHGECVSIGMAAAYRMAKRLDMVNAQTADTVFNVLQKAGLPIRAQGLDMDSVYKNMFHDKKIKNNRLVFVLPKGIGEVIQCYIEDEALIKEVLAEIES